MLRVIASFAFGVVVTSAVFLIWDGSSDREANDESGSASPEGLSREMNDVSLQPSQSASDGADADARGVGVGMASTQSPGNNPDGDESEHPFADFATVMRTTAGEVERILEQSFGILSATPNRHSAFEDEARMRDPTSTSLEGVLANEAWNAAPIASSPVSIDTECRVSACRVRFAFGTDEAFLSALESATDLKLLVALQEQGFSAVDTRIDPEGHDRTLDVYLWREGMSPP